MGVRRRSRGDFRKLRKFLDFAIDSKYMSKLEEYGKRGVEALAQATPQASGLTAASWDYKIESYHSGVRISWFNTNEKNTFKIAIGIEYGHGTRNGKYVKGRPFINDAIAPIFDEMADAIWKEVTNA